MMTSDDEREMAEFMKVLAAAIDATINGPVLPAERHTGFFLLLAPFEDAEGRANYIGSVTREDAIRLMRETADRMEASPGAGTPTH